jgi:hypothetical protein
MRTALAVLLLVCSVAFSEDDAEVFRFRLTMSGHTDMELDGKRHKVGSETVINYVRRRQGHDVNVICESVAVKNTTDGTVSYEGAMDRQKASFTVPGGKKQFASADSDPALKKTLEASFGPAIAKLELDDNGVETKKSITSDPAAKDFVASGMVTNCLLFHAPYPADKPTWSRAIEYSMLGGGSAIGELNYEKLPASPGDSPNDKQAAVKVIGVIKAPIVRDSAGRIMARNIQMDIQGQQTYDLATKEWIAGAHTATMTFALPDGDRGLTAAKCVLEIKLERVSEPKKR